MRKTYIPWGKIYTVGRCIYRRGRYTPWDRRISREECIYTVDVLTYIPWGKMYTVGDAYTVGPRIHHGSHVYTVGKTYTVHDVTYIPWGKKIYTVGRDIYGG